MGAAVITVERVGYITRYLHSGSKIGAIPRFMQSLGLDVKIASDTRITPDWADAVFLHGSMNWFPRALGSLTAMPPRERPRTIFWHTEPLPLPSSANVRPPLPTLAEFAKILLRDSRATDPRSNARTVKRMWRHGIPDVLTVSTASRRSWLAEQGIESHFIPAGFAPQHGEDLGLDRDIPALFVGIMTDPRHRRAVRFLRSAGIDVVARGDWSKAAGLWGDDRTRLINRAQTFLALQRNPRELSGVRMIFGMANRSLVISEPIDQPEPYIPGTHYVSTPLEDMPDVIRYYTSHPGEAKKIADAGYHFVTTELTFERCMTRLIEVGGLL